MKHHFSITHKILSRVVGISLGTLVVGVGAVTLAQTSGPKVTSVTVSTVTNTSASIRFSTDVAAGAKIAYGKTTAYGTSSPALGYTTPETSSHTITLNNLEAATTYHFQIEVNNSAGTTTSADRTFTTRSGTAAAGPLVLNNIIADCVDTRCQILFTPNRAASVRVVWGSTQEANFDDYPTANIVAEPLTAASANRRALIIPNQTDGNGDGFPDAQFTSGTIYYYRLQAFEGGVATPVLTTANLQLRTGLNANDHTFTTGGCNLPDGSTIAIGQCGPGGFYCPSGGGDPVLDCTQSCGYICPQDSTCRTSGVCEADPSMNGSPFQCNKTTTGPTACYDDTGNLKTPAPAGCYSTWGKCTANTILKVQKDRGCNLWLSCETSVQTEAKVGAPAENLCLSLAACNSLNQEGQCNRYLPQGQCDNDPLRFCSTDAECTAGGSCNLPSSTDPTQSLQDLTFTTPDQVQQIANLSGSVIAGLDWNTVGGANVLQGNFPWQLMRQVGGSTSIFNGDLEYHGQNIDPWIVVPSQTPNQAAKIVFENQNDSTNHVLRFEFVTSYDKTDGVCSNDASKICESNTVCGTGNICKIGTCTLTTTKSCATDADCSTADGTCDTKAALNFSGVATNVFSAAPSELYFAEVRLRADQGKPKVRVQFVDTDETTKLVLSGADAIPAAVDVETTAAWQRVTLGPFRGLSGQTKLSVVCADNASCEGGIIFIDDLQIRPVLQINSNPSFVTPSCRLYPRDDSPSCDYIDQTGVLYKGWKGYCLENDSVTGTCLSWWPVDILQGESSIFGTDTRVGYKDQAPLYLCAESEGNFNRPDPVDGTPSLGYRQQLATNATNYQSCSEDASTCTSGSGRGIGGGSNTSFGGSFSVNAADAAIHEADIYGIYLEGVAAQGGFGTVTEILRKDSKYTAGCNNIYANKDWSACYTWPSNDNPQYFTVHFDFDPVDGHLQTIQLWGEDGTNLSGSLYSRVYFILKERCTKLIEVVRPDLTNAAFSTRVTSDVYQVPETNHQRGTDFLPFGAVLPPQNTGTSPATWPLLNVEKPNTVTFEGSGQARAGTPYACNGDCSGLMCSVSFGNDCSTPEKVRECQNTDITNDGQGDGQCIGVGNATMSSKGTQQFDPSLDPTLTGGGAVCVAARSLSCNKTAVTGKQSFLGASTTQAAIRTQMASKCSALGVACDGTSTACSGGQDVAYKLNSTTIHYSSPNVGSAEGIYCSSSQFAFNQVCQARCGVAAATYTSVNGAVADTYFAEQHIRRLFTEGYSVWNWNGVAYTQSQTSAWVPPTNLCSGGVRPAYPNDYCGIPPVVVSGSAKFVNGSGSQALITGGNGSVGIKFNTDANGDQQPLNGFTIDWGDVQVQQSYAFTPKNDPLKPHIFSHVYNNTGPTCTSAGQTNCCTITNGKKLCEYMIRIQVKDNWGWCNNGVNGNPCPSDTSNWYSTGLKVRIEP